MYAKREDGRRGLKSFKVYDETKVRVACYMATPNNEWIKVSWRNEYMKEQILLKRVAEEIMGRTNVQIEFNAGDIRIENKTYVDWKVAGRKLKNIIRKGQIKNKFESFREKRLQRETPMGFEKDDYGWLKCNTDPRKIASIFFIQEQMIETKAWKKMKELVNQDKCSLCGEFRETV